jgi:flagellar L-ring protein precursor FlgH
MRDFPFSIFHFRFSTCIVMVLLFLNIFLGCSTPQKVTEEAQIPKPPPLPPIPTPQEGSVWTPRSQMLFSDLRARQVGDIVTVNIAETSTASNSATTETERKSDVDAGIEALFGYEKELQWHHAANDPKTMIKGSLAHKHKGTGETTRGTEIVASLAATVIEVLPSGNLVIFGSREIRVNNENQIMVLQGTIRPVDIGSDNTILSTFIADCKISYYGRGIISDKQRPGWMARILDHVWPF